MKTVVRTSVLSLLFLTVIRTGKGAFESSIIYTATVEVEANIILNNTATVEVEANIILNNTGEVEDVLAWNYDEASDWNTLYPMYCNGTRQSPINIDSNNTMERTDLIAFNLENYDVVPTEQIVVYNKGVYLTLYFNTSTAPTLSGGGLDGEYIYHSSYIHLGSEHTINGVRYPLELHIVNIKKEYGNYTAALNHPDGLEILAILFEISPTENMALDPVLDTFPAIENGGSAIINGSTDLTSFFPDEPTQFYRYAGGLTHPACNEIAYWTVFQKTSNISISQFAKFSTLKDRDGSSFVDNYRPTQPLNGRPVYFSPRSASSSML